MAKMFYLSIIAVVAAAMFSSTALAIDTRVLFKINTLTGITSLDNSDGTSINMSVYNNTDGGSNLIVSRYAEPGTYIQGQTMVMNGSRVTLIDNYNYTLKVSTQYGDFYYNFSAPTSGIDTSDATAVDADIRSTKTAYLSDGTKHTGSVADCSDGGSSCYVASGKRYASECVDSTTGTKTNCYIGTTAKFVDADACLASSNTGYCYMNASTFSGMDSDLAAGNVKSGKNIFGVDGSYSCPTCPSNFETHSMPNADTSCTTTCASYGATCSRVDVNGACDGSDTFHWDLCGYTGTIQCCLCHT